MVPLTEKSSKYGIDGIREATQSDASSDVPAVGRALDVLELLASAAEPLTLAQITNALRLPKGSAHRLLATLRGRGYIAFASQAEGSGTNRGTGYVLGTQISLLVSRAPAAPDLMQAAREPMKQLAHATGEGCQLSVRAGNRAVCIARTVSPVHPDVALMGAVGASFPLHAVAVGKVLLAFAPPDEQAAYLTQQLPAFTPRTLTVPDALRRELDSIYAGGLDAVARDREEYKRGLCALAAPVWDANGTVCAALGLPLLAGGQAQGGADYAADLTLAARAIGQALGHRAEK